jgi:putative DNA primase/helicase
MNAPLNAVALSDIGAIQEILEPPPAHRDPDLILQQTVARGFAKKYAGHLRHDRLSRFKWFEWSGAHWREDVSGNSFRLACAYTEELAKSLERRGRRREAASIGKLNYAREVLAGAAVDPAIATDSALWDENLYLIGTPKGTLDLKTGALRDADPGDMLTKLTAVTPAERADCPRWRQFLDEATGGDDELIRFLQRFAGYSLTGSAEEHAMLFIHGPGGNGKSVFCNVIEGILCDYAKTPPMDALMATNNPKHETEIAMLKGARLVVASETEAGRAWNEPRLKKLTSSDTITGRFMRADHISFRATFKVLIAGNHRPTLRNVDDAIRRRMNLIEFNRRPALVDTKLEEKLRDEWPAIMRWMVDGCLDWQRHGLIRPQSVATATDEYMAAQDSFGAWLEDRCDVDIGNRSKTAAGEALRTSWAEYAKSLGEEPGSSKRFADEMQKRGFERCKIGGERGFNGLRLKPRP